MWHHGRNRPRPRPRLYGLFRSSVSPVTIGGTSTSEETLNTLFEDEGDDEDDYDLGATRLLAPGSLALTSFGEQPQGDYRRDPRRIWRSNPRYIPGLSPDPRC
jgi:hypothetical protein